MHNDVEEQDLRTYIGFVIDNKDPLPLHRVCASIPGLTEDTGWMYPASTAGGGLQHGGHIAPKVGSRVRISQEMGDVERMVYEPHGWVEEDVPADITAAGAEAHLVQAFEFAKLGPLSFRVTLDERPATRAFRIYAVDTENEDDLVVALELDLVSRGVVVYGLTGVELRSLGFIQLSGAIIQMNERPVQPKSSPI